MPTTIATTDSRFTFTASGVGPYNFPRQLLAVSDIKVRVDGVLQTLNTHYTVSLTGSSPVYDSANVTFGTAPTAGAHVEIMRDIALTQQAVNLAGGGVYDTLNVQFTRDEMKLQALADKINRAPHVGNGAGASFDGLIAADVEGKAGYVPMLTGSPTPTGWTLGLPISSAIAVSAVMAPVVTAATLVDAKDILGIEYWIEDFYQSADGDDWGLTIARAIAAVVTEMATSTSYSGRIRFRARNYNMATAVTIGNGSASAYSTINGLVLVGCGAPFPRLDSSAGPLEDNGTRFTWTGAAGATMVTIAGPCHGNAIQNIGLNCNDLAAKGLRLVSASRGEFPCISISDATSVNLQTYTVETESIGGLTEALGCEGNSFYNLRISASDGGANTTAIDLDGYLGSASNGHGTTRNYFYNTYLTVHRTGGTGIRLAHCDQNVFHGLVMSGFNTVDGNQASIRYAGVATVPGGFRYPANNCFTGHIDIGQTLPVASSGTPGGGNLQDNMTSFDSQVAPRDPVTKFLRFRMSDRSTAFPNGEFWSEGGLTVLERAWRNRLLNSKFERATGGTSFVNPLTGAELMDGWSLNFDSSVTVTVTRERFTTGQNDVPFEPRYFMRIAVSAASGNTFFFLRQIVPSSETLEGRLTTLSAWMKADATRAVSARMEQNYGTGGSPSATTVSTAAAQDVTTSWTRFAYEVAMGSTSGKTIGSNGDDTVHVLYSMPINTALTIDIALPAWEAGKVDTAPDLRPHWSEEPGYWTNPVNIEAEAALTGAADRLSYYTSATAKALATFTSFARTLLDDADATAARSTLGLVIGTNVQAFDAELAAIAGLTSAADKVPYFTGSGTAAVADFTSFGRSLVDDANAAAARTTIGIGMPGNLVFTISAVDFNSANTDNLITITLPSGFTRYKFSTIIISGASASLTTATCGVFTDTAAGGTAIVASGSAITVNTASEGTNNNMQSLVLINANSASWTDTTIYFRVQNPQGSAATGDVTVNITLLP